jgi:hypothetical protein
VVTVVGILNADCGTPMSGIGAVGVFGPRPWPPPWLRHVSELADRDLRVRERRTIARRVDGRLAVSRRVDPVHDRLGLDEQAARGFADRDLAELPVGAGAGVQRRRRGERQRMVGEQAELRIVERERRDAAGVEQPAVGPVVDLADGQESCPRSPA